MEKKFSLILWMASAVTASIIVFQVYWVWQGYQTSQRNFQQTVVNALQKSINTFELQRADLPNSLFGKNPYLSVINSISDTNAIPISKDVKRNIIGKKFTLKVAPLKVAPEDLEAVRLLMARLATQATIKLADTAFISRRLRAELVKDNITLPFKLYLVNKGRHTPTGAITVSQINRDQQAIAAFFTGAGNFLFKQNLLPALVSLVLVLLSVGSLWYLGINIRKQMQLNDLKDDFISNITHELRTPISVLKSTNEALLQFGEIGNREKAERYLNINAGVLNKLDQNVDRLLGIVGNAESHTAVSCISVDINELIRDIIGRFGSENSIIYQSEISPSVLKTDKYVIDTVLSNLIDNAIKYNQSRPEISVTAMQKAAIWQLQVKDNGIGIRKEYLQLIFDRYYRIPTGELHEVKGFGLGLSYVKRLVTAMDGTISVKSMPGRGSIFTIRLPIV